LTRKSAAHPSGVLRPERIRFAKSPTQGKHSPLKKERKMKRITTGIVRIDQARLSTPKAFGLQKTARYGAQFLLPKNDLITQRNINLAIADAIAEGLRSEWAATGFPHIEMPIRDADELFGKGVNLPEEYRGCHIIRASNRYKPMIVNTNLAELDPDEAMYDGVFCCASIKFFPYATARKTGIGCELGPIMKVADAKKIKRLSEIETAFGAITEAWTNGTAPREYFKPEQNENQETAESAAIAENESQDETTPPPWENEENKTLEYFFESNKNKTLSLSEFKKMFEENINLE
jgi:hypothetical protein